MIYLRRPAYQWLPALPQAALLGINSLALLHQRRDGLQRPSLRDHAIPPAIPVPAKKGPTFNPWCLVTISTREIQQWLYQGCFVASVLSPIRQLLPMRYMNSNSLAAQMPCCSPCRSVLENPPCHLSCVCFLGPVKAVRCLRPSSFDLCAPESESVCNGARCP